MGVNSHANDVIDFWTCTRVTMVVSCAYAGRQMVSMLLREVKMILYPSGQ
jgi:hypothetical protein